MPSVIAIQEFRKALDDCELVEAITKGQNSLGLTIEGIKRE